MCGVVWADASGAATAGGREGHQVYRTEATRVFAGWADFLPGLLAYPLRPARIEVTTSRETCD